MQELINNFMVLFVVIDPIGLAPIYASMIKGKSSAYVKKMAFNGVFIAFCIMNVFYFTGEKFLSHLGISMIAFKLIGGIFLFLFSLDMVFPKSGSNHSNVNEDSEVKKDQHEDDISVFPLAFPLMSGPGTLTTLLLMSASKSGIYDAISMVSILFLIMLLCYLALIFTPVIMKIIKESGANVLSRMFGVLLGALAGQFILDSLGQAFPTLIKISL